jgi:hypothetical protein
MPEFILNTEGATPDQFDALDAFTRGFIECLFFQDVSCYPSAEFFGDEAQEDVREGRADGSLPNDAGPADLEPAALEAIKTFCAAFQVKAADLLQEAYGRGYEEEQAGRDLCFTYGGAGVGFTDREALEGDGEEYDEAEYARLTARMVAPGLEPGEWGRLLDQRNALRGKSLAERLEEACGRGEISPDAYEDSAAPCGFYVSVYIG